MSVFYFPHKSHGLYTIVYMCLVMIPLTGLAQITSTRSGNWNAGSTWAGGVAPAATDEVVIASGHTVTVTANASCCNYYIQSGATLSINSGITLTCTPGACTNTGIPTANSRDNKGTISGAGTFYINPNSSAAANASYENNGIISVSNFVLNNAMVASSSDDLIFENGNNATGSITSTNLIIRNTSGNDTYINNDLSSSISSTNITIENLNNTWNSWVFIYNASGSVTASTITLNNTNTTDGEVYLDNASTATVGNFTTTTSGGNRLYYYAYNGATLNYSGASVHSAIRIDVNAASNTVNFNSTSATQDIPVPKNYSSGTTSNYYNLTLNNTYSAYPQFTMSGNIATYNTLTLTSGIVNMNAYRFTLGDPSGTSGTLNRTSGHFYSGTFRRYFTSGSNPGIGSNAGLFPLGTSYYSPASSAYYRPFWLGATNITNSTDLYMEVSHTFSLPSTYTNASHVDATWAGGTIVQGVSNAYWTATRTFLTSSRSIRYGGEGFGSVTLTDLNASQSASASVGSYAAATNVVVSLEVNRSFTNSPSIDNSWYIGTKNKAQSPLPVELISFSAEPENQQVKFSWITANELNNDYFTVERSLNGNDFLPLVQVKGAGNSQVQLQYEQWDQRPPAGQLYYRLKQTDFDGSLHYSKVVVLNNTVAHGPIELYPNPAEYGLAKINLDLSFGEDPQLEIISVSGQTIFSGYVHNTEHQEHLQIALNDLADLKSGSYLLKVKTSQYCCTRKLIVR